MVTENPFSLMYGKIPASFIERDEEFIEITNTFSSKVPSTLAYMITGVRGAGKTVLMREVAKALREKQGFITVDLNPQGKLIESFAQKLFYEGRAHKLFQNFELTIDFKFAQLSIGGEEKINDPEVVAERLIKDAKRKILVTIDETNNTQEMKKFANFYQSMIGEGYEVYLLMTGLKNNIDALIQSKAASFLSRTPKIVLGPLDLVAIVNEYARVFGIDAALASQLARLTKGYAFAYQVLGYFFYESKFRQIEDGLLRKYDEYLRKNGYEVIWNELTAREQQFCIALHKSIGKEAKEILRLVNIKESNYQNYRGSLIEKGIIEAKGYGKLDFTLPRFDEFINAMMVYFD